MYGMFRFNRAAEHNINNWDVSKVTTIERMFEANRQTFDLSSWDTSSIGNIGWTFYNAWTFNSDITGWDVSQVSQLVGTFHNARDFNQPIQVWDTSKVTNFWYTFNFANNFVQDLDMWDVQKSTSCSLFHSPSTTACSPWFPAGCTTPCYCVPTISSIQGCSVNSDDGLSTSECVAGDVVTVTGTHFGPNLNLLVGGLSCTNYVFDNILDDDVFECELPGGSGDGADVQLDIVGCNSEVVNLISFSSPTVTALHHPNCTETDTAALIDCPREEVGTLTVYGSNFGSNSAIVFVGTRACTHVVHNETNLNGVLHCDMPGGHAATANVIVITGGGGVSAAANNTMSFGGCPVGTYQLGADNECPLCPKGRYSITEGAFVCTECPAGRYQNVEGQQDCEECGAGTYSADVGQEECDDCEPGSYTAEETTKFSCRTCALGHYTEEYGQSSCEPCAAGTYSDQPFPSTCTLCPKGTTSSPGQFFCSECGSAVDFQDQLGQSTCLKCPVDSVADEDHINCLCDFGHYAIPYGDYSLFASLDPVAYDNYNALYINNDDPPFDPSAHLGIWCPLCPEGADCTEIGTTVENVTASEGFFLGTDGTGTTFLTCLNENACASDGECAEGYTGASCTICDEGLVMNEKFQCKDCPALILTVIMLLVGAAIFLFVLIFKMNDVKNGGYTEKDVFIKAAISALQVNGLALFYAFKWDSVMDFLLKFQNQLTSLGTSFINLRCMGGSTVESKFVSESFFWLFFPLILALFVLVSVFSYQMHVSGQFAQRNMPIVKRILKAAIDTVKGTMCLALFFTQPYLVRRFAVVFSCIRLGSDAGDLYLTEDMTIQCWTGIHWTYIFFIALPLFALYVFGLPFYVYMMLGSPKNLKKVTAIIKANKGVDIMGAGHSAESIEEQVEQGIASEIERAEVKPFYHNYAFLFLGYKQQSYFWESIILARKALIAIIGVFLVSDARVQCMTGLVILFAFTMLQIHYKPYEEDWLNHFEFVSLCFTMGVFFFGLFTLDPGISGSDFTAASGLATALSLIYFIYLGHNAYLIFYKKPVEALEKGLDSSNIDSDKTTPDSPSNISPPLSPVSTAGDDAKVAMATVESVALVEEQSIDSPVETPEPAAKPEKQEIPAEEEENETPVEEEAQAAETKTTESASADNENPELWVVKVDKKSGKKYYTNKKTKARVWKKPACLKSSSKDKDKSKSKSAEKPAGGDSALTQGQEAPAAEASEAAEATEAKDTPVTEEAQTAEAEEVTVSDTVEAQETPESKEGGLADDENPELWVVKVDKKSGKNYYINKTTKTRVWKKPACLKKSKSKQ